MMRIWDYITGRRSYTKVIEELQEQLEEKTFRLSLLLELSRTLISAADIDEILNIVLRVAKSVTKADTVSVALGKDNNLNLFAANGLSLNEAKVEFSRYYKETPLWNSFLTGEIYKDNEFKLGNMEIVAVFPLIVPQKIIGVLNIHKGAKLDEETVRFLETLCSQAALALQNAGDLKKARIVAKSFKQIATKDALTSLFNRLYLEEQLKAEIERAKRLDKPLSIMIFDVDHFKKFNDEYGHLFGDVVLKDVSELLKKSIRSYDCPVRYGGEEFIVILPETPADKAVNIAERLRKIIEKHEFQDPEKPHVKANVTISLGVAQWEPDISMKELIERADTALYISKSNGRNRVTLYQNQKSYGNKRV